MLSKEEIETCKEELNNYIEFMKTAGDNTGWARGLKWYIEQLETDLKEVTTQRNELATELSENEDNKQELIEKLENKTKLIVASLPFEIVEKYKNFKMTDIDDNTYELLALNDLNTIGEILSIVKGENDE